MKGNIMEIRNVKGTHDIFGEDSRIYEYIYDNFVAFASSYNTKHIIVPVIEQSDLFQRGVGEASDVVRKEMYTFLDKGNRSITLRPEFTAGIVRSFIQNKMYATMDLPIKLYYCGPVFRYERPQAGRYRQFEQLGVEFLGSDSEMVDVETISLAYNFLKSIGLGEIVVFKINSLGDEETRDNYRLALKEYFKEHLENMCDDCKNRYELNPLRILDCKVEDDKKYIVNAPRINDFYSSNSKIRFEKTLKALDLLKIPYVVDNTLVRGLDYYSETVYEIHFKDEDIGALGAGGHYSNLIEELGGPKLSGVGFSFGIERLLSLFKDKSPYYKQVIEQEQIVYIMPIGEESVLKGMEIASKLREEYIPCEMCFDNVKFGAMFKKANRLHASYALIIGEEEIKNDTYKIKDLESATQIEVSGEQLIDKIKQLFFHL